MSTQWLWDDGDSFTDATLVGEPDIVFQRNTSPSVPFRNECGRIYTDWQGNQVAFQGTAAFQPGLNRREMCATFAFLATNLTLGGERAGPFVVQVQDDTPTTLDPMFASHIDANGLLYGDDPTHFFPIGDYLDKWFIVKIDGHTDGDFSPYNVHCILSLMRPCSRNNLVHLYQTELDVIDGTKSDAWRFHRLMLGFMDLNSTTDEIDISVDELRASRSGTGFPVMPFPPGERGPWPITP